MTTQRQHLHKRLAASERMPLSPIQPNTNPNKMVSKRTGGAKRTAIFDDSNDESVAKKPRRDFNIKFSAGHTHQASLATIPGSPATKPPTTGGVRTRTKKVRAVKKSSSGVGESSMEMRRLQNKVRALERKQKLYLEEIDEKNTVIKSQQAQIESFEKELKKLREKKIEAQTQALDPYAPVPKGQRRMDRIMAEKTSMPIDQNDTIQTNQNDVSVTDLTAETDVPPTSTATITTTETTTETKTQVEKQQDDFGFSDADFSSNASAVLDRDFQEQSAPQPPTTRQSMYVAHTSSTGSKRFSMAPGDHRRLEASASIRIQNLQPDATKAQVLAICKPFGSVHRCKLEESFFGAPKAYVEFANSAQAQKAIQKIATDKNLTAERIGRWR